jgi:uncharacterized protein (DUF488 family)
MDFKLLWMFAVSQRPRLSILERRHGEMVSKHGMEEYVWLGTELGDCCRDGYKKHMCTRLFRGGIKHLLEIADEKRTCIMFAEANPKYCHGRFFSTHLERKQVKVIHIIAEGQKNLD